MPTEETKGNLETQMYEIVLNQTKSHDAALFAYMATKQMGEHLGKFLQSHSQSGATFTKEDVERCFEGKVSLKGECNTSYTTVMGHFRAQSKAAQAS